MVGIELWVARIVLTERTSLRLADLPRLSKETTRRLFPSTGRAVR